MSHISTFQTEIRIDNALLAGRTLESDQGYDILKEAVEIVAAEMGLEVSSQIRDYFEKPNKVDFALAGVDIPRGVGVKVSRATGAVEFVYDAYGGYDRKARQICEAIVQNYQTIAITRALQSMNYAVEFQEEQHPIDGRMVTVKGVL